MNNAATDEIVEFDTMDEALAYMAATKDEGGFWDGVKLWGTRIAIAGGGFAAGYFVFQGGKWVYKAVTAS